MLIKDIVKNNLITCNEDSTIENVCELMARYNIGFIPIKNNLKIIGVVTDRDIIVRAIAKTEITLSNIISYEIVDIDINQSIDEALKLLRNNKIRRLLVKDFNNYVGVISISDIIKKDSNNKNIIPTLESIYEDQINIEPEVDEFIL